MASLPASILEKSRMFVDDREQGFAGPADQVGVFALLGRQAGCRAAGRSCR